VRDLPPPARATPIEFLEALGSLYRKAGAASTAVSIAWERFRRHSLRLCGHAGEQDGRGRAGSGDSPALSQGRRQPGSRSGRLRRGRTWGETVNPRQALKLIQTLHGHYEKLKEAARPGSAKRQVGRTI
jgi:hypothetical protein